MPRFKYQDLSSWRVFFQMFPESAHLLETMFRYPSHWSAGQLKAGFLLASTLANTDDQATSNKAHDLLQLMMPHLNMTHAHNYHQYAMLREYYFTYAEAWGTHRSVNWCLNFIHQHPIDWELRLNREYYSDRTDVTTEQALRKKIEAPKPRDINTMPINEMLLARVHQVPRNI